MFVCLHIRLMTEPPRHASAHATMTDRAAGDLTSFGVLATLLRRRRAVLSLWIACILASLAFVLLKQRTFTTVFSFIPQTTQDPTKAGLAGLAGQFGVTLNTGGAQPQSPQMYADLLQTREVLGPIAGDSFIVERALKRALPLSALLGVDEADTAVSIEKTLLHLRERVVSSSVATRTTGVVTVRVKTRWAELSRSIAERLLSGLNRYNLITRQSQAGEERRFTEGRLTLAKAAQRTDELVLERFLKTNRQYSNSPELTFEQERLQREVSMQQQIVTSLAQQYEEARIREVRDIPVITVIEKPLAPAQPDSRGGVLILLGGTLIGFFVGVTFAVLSDELARVRNDPAPQPEFNELRAEWQQTRRARS